MSIKRREQTPGSIDTRPNRLNVLKTIPEIVKGETHQKNYLKDLSDAQRAAVTEETLMRKKLFALIEMRKNLIVDKIQQVFGRYELNDPNQIKINIRVAPTFDDQFVEYVVLVERFDGVQLEPGSALPVVAILENLNYIFNDVPFLIDNNKDVSSIRFFIRDVAENMVNATKGVTLGSRDVEGVVVEVNAGNGDGNERQAPVVRKIKPYRKNSLGDEDIINV